MTTPDLDSRFRLLKIFGFVTFLLATLAACDSAEERAEEHYQNSLALIAEGDIDRAMVELRNVFQLFGSHREARHSIADLLLNHYGDRQGAYSQYLRLAEQYPDDLEARIILSEVAFSAASWEEVERHGAKAEELDPNDLRVRAISIARAYRNAAIDQDQPARRDQVRAAEALLKQTPDSVLLRSVVLDGLLQDGELTSALTSIDWLLEKDPENIRLWRQRLNILGRLDDIEGVEAQLRDMVVRFPDDVSNKQTLIRLYMSRGQLDDVENFLRELQDAADPEDNRPRLDLISFLTQARGADVAMAEIEAAIAEANDPTPFHVLKAGLEFEQGRRDEAVALLEDVLKDTETLENTSNVKITLARMLVAMGNPVGARARVEEVLEQDPGHAEALKMRAVWLIDGDDTDGAIAALRLALDSSPDDAQAMTLMAQAYSRAGHPELSRDFLALAVDASGNAPAETIRFARLLISEESYLPAEDVLLPALRLAPQNLDILQMLGQLYLASGDYSRVEQVVNAIRQIETGPAQQLASGLEAERLNRQAGPDEAIRYLEELASTADATLSSQLALVRAQLASRNFPKGRELALEFLEQHPDNLPLTVALAATEALLGNHAKAETLYRKMLDETPKLPNLWLALSQLKLRQGEPDTARILIDEAIALMPGDINLLWAQASYLEQDGNIDAAIEIYEGLYAQNSGEIVIANNLASLLSTYRTDAESLERAWVIARRFRTAEAPALKDTYGWIEHRRGNSAKALPYLEDAAQGLPGDPLVQYHLGKTYETLGRIEDARAQFQRVLTIAGPADTREQIKDARKLVNSLPATQDTEEDAPKE